MKLKRVRGRDGLCRWFSLGLTSVGLAALSAACSGASSDTDGFQAQDAQQEPTNSDAGIEADGAVAQDAAHGDAGSDDDADSMPQSDASDEDEGEADATSSDACAAAENEGDKPDQEFIDSNCDGIDGDVSRAIFVAPSGSDEAPGTMAKPVQTVTKAVELAQEQTKDVYLCSATYAENVVIQGVSVGLYGGYDCENGWSRSQTQAQLAPESGVPLTLRDLETALEIQRLQLSAPNAVEVSTSSIALFAVSTAELMVSHSAFEAGNGAQGQAGEPVFKASQTSTANPGHSLSEVTCPLSGEMPVACKSVADGGDASAWYFCPTGGTVRGGEGGHGANVSKDVEFEQGSTGSPSAGSTSGKDGADGTNGKDGKAVSVSLGSFDQYGYVPPLGEPGTNGKPGKSGTGGRGGASRFCCGDVPSGYYVGGGGGGGGRAGCGGLAGNPGRGGGASIAVLLIDTKASFEWSTFQTATGGKGGAGSAGAEGQMGVPGALGGQGTCGGTGCEGQKGGRGGDGGKGGAGGPGSGGPSIGIVAKGFAPWVTTSTFDIGLGGEGASAVSGSSSGDAAGGLSQDVHLIDVVEP